MRKKIKLVFTADMHLGITPVDLWMVEVEKIKAEKPDIVVIGGDFSPDINRVMESFDIFSDINALKCYVVGNHDIWVVDGIGNSFYKYHMLTELDCGFCCLDDSPRIFEKDGYKIGLVGNMGWYDYSFRDKQIDILYPLAMASYKQKKFPNGKAKWMDGKYAKWLSTDAEMSKFFANLLDNHIRKMIVCDVDVICCFTHHIPFEKMVKKDTEDWNMGNAFCGSKKIDKVIRKYDKIKYVFCGHSHTEFKGKLYGKKCYNVGSDYRKPKYLVVKI